MSPNYLTVAEVSEYLKLPEETVYKYARTGRMPASKVGRYWRFEQTRIDDWVEGNSNQGSAAMRVMVVDDDPAVRTLLTKWLMEWGCEVATFSGGHEAVEAVQAEPCDLVLLDLMMPSPNGVETLGNLRQVRPGLEVVIITAFFDSKLMDEALQFGPLTILKKPIGRDVLVTLLNGMGAKVKVVA